MQLILTNLDTKSKTSISDLFINKKTYNHCCYRMNINLTMFTLKVLIGSCTIQQSIKKYDIFA